MKAVQRSERSILTSLISLFDLRKLRQAKNIYRIVLFVTFISAIRYSPSLFVSVEWLDVHDWLIDLIAPLTTYFVVALIGFNLYLKRYHRLLLFTQLGFISFSVFLFLGNNIVTSSVSYQEINAALLFASYMFLFFTCEFALLGVKLPPSKLKKWLLRFAVLSFFLAFEFVLYSPLLPESRGNPKAEFLNRGLLFLGFYVIAIASLVRVKQKGVWKGHLVFFQSALLAVLTSLLASYLKPIFQYPPSATIHQYFYYSMSALTVCSVFCFGLNSYVLPFWRRQLVAKPEARGTQKPISIYPDASTYVDVNGKAAWLKNFIETSDGGVIGITGVRGAGKSALLNKVISELKGEYFTLHITSPVHSSDRMEFFMMVCREVCAKVIYEIEGKIFHLKDTSYSKAKEGLFSSMRLVVLFLIIGVGILVLSLPHVNPASSERKDLVPISLDIVEQWRSNGMFWGNYYFRLLVRNADSSCIESLLNDLNTFLKNENSTFNAVAIVPNTRDGLIRAMPVQSNFFNIGEFHQALVSNLYKQNQSRQFPVPYYISSRFGEETLQWFYYDQMIEKPQNLLGWHQAIENGSDAYLIARILVEGAPELFPPFSAEAFYPYILRLGEKIIDGSNPAEIAGRTAAVGQLFGVRSRIRLDSIVFADPSMSASKVSYYADHPSPKLLSWILLEAYYRNAVSNKPRNCTLDRFTRAPQLRDLLQEYMSILYGKQPTTYSETNRSFVLNTISPLWQNGWIILLAILFIGIIAGPFLIRKTNSFLSALINYKAFGLLQRSRDFLSLLSYSESKEKSGEISLPKGLRFSTSRKLTERNLTLPALTNRFIQYVPEIAELFSHKIIIAIDELDKIDDPDVVKHILQEVKGALFVKSAYYLISISEDAAHSFENRLSSGRDIFESTFDELITIRRLNCEQSWPVIERRIHTGDYTANVVTSDQTSQSSENDVMRSNADALTLQAGGIPREIIRNLREILLKYSTLSSPSPTQVCAFLLMRKTEEFMYTLDEVQISGDESLELYHNLKGVIRILADNDPISIHSIKDIIDKLEDSIGIVDPKKLYYSVTDSSSEKLRSRYKAIKEDIQALIELLTRARVLLFYSGSENRNPVNAERLQRTVFSVYDALDSNPALAKHILSEEESDSQG